MAARTITIARAIGAGGEEIGRLVADRLGYDLVDDEILLRAAHEAGIPREAVAMAEQTRPLLARILETFAAAQFGQEDALVAGPVVLAAPPFPLEGLIVGVIRAIAAERESVIIGHGASIALSARNDVLRVFVTASEGVRRSRLMEGSGLNEREADKALRYSDRQRAEFLRRFFAVPRELPTHYDIVLNTDRLTFDAAAELLCQTAQALK